MLETLFKTIKNNLKTLFKTIVYLFIYTNNFNKTNLCELMLCYVSFNYLELILIIT